MFRFGLVLVASFVLLSCGHEICVGPFGSCWQNANNGSTSSSSGTLTITAPASIVSNELTMTSASTTLVFQVSGGYGTYSWSVPTVGGVVSSATFSAATGTSSTLTVNTSGTGPGSFIVQARDTTNTKQYPVTVNRTN